MKNLIILILCLLTNSAFSQWDTYTIPYSSTNINIRINKPSFPTADIGFVIASTFIGGFSYAKLFKTTNKCVTWNDMWDVPQSSYSNFGLYFLDVNTGFIAKMTTGATPRTIITYKTTDGGYTWNNAGQIGNLYYGVLGLSIYFVNLYTGFLWNGLNVYKTTDAGNNWILILNGPTNNFSEITGLAVSKYDNNIYVGGSYTEPPNDNPVLFKSTNSGSNFTVIENGYNNNSLVHGIRSLSLVNAEDLFCGAYGGLGKLINNELILVSDIYTGKQNQTVCFTNNHYGVMYGEDNIDNGVATTTDGGNTWAVDELDLNFAKIVGFTNIGDVIYGTYFDPTMPINTQSTFVTSRRIGITLNSNFDWQYNTYPGGFYADGQPFETPNTNAQIRGGTINVGLHDSYRFKINGSDTLAAFYYWGGTNSNASTNWQSNEYYVINRIDEINADYKLHMKSNTADAINTASQTKSIVDANGVINTIYVSMQGIFYTRSYDNKNKFKNEEYLSVTDPSLLYGYATFGNSNPFITEIKPLGAGITIDPEKNVAATWEQRNGTNIDIKYSERSVLSTWFPWYTEQQAVTISNASGDFKSYPKLFVAKNPNSNPVTCFKLITYLRPAAGGFNEIVINAKKDFNGQQTRDFIIDAGNIQTYAVTGTYISYAETSYDLHFTYMKNGRLWYKHTKINADPQWSCPEKLDS